MKRGIVVLLLVILAFSKGNAQITFVKSLSAGAEEFYLYSSQEVDSGYIFYGTTYLWGVGDWKPAVLKTDFYGNIIWSKRIGTGFGPSMCKTYDNAIVLAMGSMVGFSVDEMGIRLTKIDLNGNIIWSKTVNGPTILRPSCIKQTNDNGFIITGHSVSTGHEDIYLLRTDSVGNYVWSRVFSFGIGVAVQQTTDGGFILGCEGSASGIYLIKTDSAGNTIWRKSFISSGSGSYQCQSIEQTNDGGYILIGGTGEVLLIKTDSAGNITWSKQLHNTPGRYGHQTSDGGYIIAGTSDLGKPALLKLNSLGSLIWARSYAGTGTTGYYVAVTTDGGYMFSAAYGGAFGAARPNLIKTDSLGNTNCNDTITPWVSSISLQDSIPMSIDSSEGVIKDTILTAVNFNSISVYTLCTSLSVEENDFSDLFSIYPNPASSTISISFPTATSQTIKTKITSVTGELIFQQENKATVPVTRYELPVSKLCNGIYFLSVQTEGEMVTRKIVVQH